MFVRSNRTERIYQSMLPETVLAAAVETVLQNEGGIEVLLFEANVAAVLAVGLLVLAAGYTVFRKFSGDGGEEDEPVGHDTPSVQSAD